MAYDYARIRDDVAAPLLQEFGITFTLSRIENTTVYTKHYDPTTMSHYWTDTDSNRYDTMPDPVQIEYTGYCIMQKYQIEQIDGTLVQADDLRLIATGIPQPKEGDIFSVNGIDYQYVRVDPVAPAGLAVVYKIQVRK